MKNKNFLTLLVISFIIASCSAARAVSTEKSASIPVATPIPSSLTHSAISTPQNASEYHAGDPVENASQAQSIAETVLKNEASISYTEPLTPVKIAVLSLGEFNHLLQLPYGQLANLGSNLYFESESHKQHQSEKYYQAVWVVIFFSDQWQSTLAPINKTPFPAVPGCYYVAITADGGSTMSMGSMEPTVLTECKK